MGAGASFIDVEELTEALEQDFARVVPRTPRGSLDVASCDRVKVRQVVDSANKRVEKRYADAWNKCAVVRGETIPAVDELRDACAALVEDFHEKAPRCALAADAGVSALVDMASRCGAALHEALERLVTRAGGEYVHGPQKAAERIAEKAKNDYAPYANVFERGERHLKKWQELSPVIEQEYSTVELLYHCIRARRGEEGVRLDLSLIHI